MVTGLLHDTFMSKLLTKQFSFDNFIVLEIPKRDRKPYNKLKIRFRKEDPEDHENILHKKIKFI